jgi:RHS repeat-associated protein
LAAFDAADGLYLAWEEPVEVASGFTLDTSMAVLRQGQPVQGTVSRLSPQLFRWQPVEESQWLVGGQYTLSAVHLQDLSGKAATAPSLTFTHLAGSNEVAYLVYQVPSDSQPQARSAYGLTTLFQGRTWHEELGLYYYRARWYSPELGDFLQRDPLGYLDSPNLYQFVNRNPVNFLDPLGLYEKDIHFYAVYYLARKAGFAREQAEQIAWASQQVDDHPATCPDEGCYMGWVKAKALGFPEPVARVTDRAMPLRFWPVPGGFINSLKAFHFVSTNFSHDPVVPSNPAVMKVVYTAIGSRDLIRLGIALHSLADSYSHEGFVGYLNTSVNDRPNQQWWNFIDWPPDIGHADAGHTPDQPYEDPGKALSALSAVYGALAMARGGAARPWGEVFGELASNSFWPVFEFKDGTRTRISALVLRDAEPGRSELWRRLILKELGEWVTYEAVDSKKNPSWVEAFDRARRQQRDFVLFGGN